MQIVVEYHYKDGDIGSHFVSPEENVNEILTEFDDEDNVDCLDFILFRPATKEEMEVNNG